MPKKEIFYTSAPLVASREPSASHTSPSFSIQDRARRMTWNVCWNLLYRTSPRPLHAWRIFLLRLFGAQMGADCHFYPGSRIYAPWNLTCGEGAAAADGAHLYNPAPLSLGAFCIISQEAYICGATHDYEDLQFPLIAYSMSIGSRAWICARACVAPGIDVGEGAVLGLASVATKDLVPWTVYAGAPAVRVKERLKPEHL